MNGKWKLTKALDFEGNIFVAAVKGKPTSIIYLLANGTNVNEKHHKDQDGELKNIIEELKSEMEETTPMHFAALKGHLRVVEYLVNQKDDINVKDKDGRTPIELESQAGKSNVVVLLQNKGGQ